MAEFDSSGIGVLQPVNVGNSLAQGFQMGNQAALNQIQREAAQQELENNKHKLEQSKAMQDLKIKALNNPEAAAIIAHLDPEYGKNIQEYHLKKAEYYGSQAKAIINLPIGMRNEAYKNLYRNAEANNEDVSGYPLPDGEWSNVKEEALKYISNASIGAQKQIENLNKEKEFNLDAAYKTAQIRKLNQEASGKPNPEQSFKNATALRNDYLNNSKTFQGVKDGYERVVASATNPNPTSDISLVFSYIKTLDPSSTVREGEFKTVQEAKPILDKYGIGYLARAFSGEGLTPQQRDQIVDRAEKLYRQAETSQEKIVNQYSNIAKRNNLNPEDVIVDFKTTVPEKAEMTPIPKGNNQYRHLSNEEIMKQL